MNSRKRITVALVGLVALVVVGWLVRDVTATHSKPPTTVSSQVPGSSSRLPVTALSSLPPEAKRTWALIAAGGPFPFPGKDGVVFGNREGRLPAQRSGYYHEYTVHTPGSTDRGARRMITGSSSEVYYTNDHYNSFVVVDTKR